MTEERMYWVRLDFEPDKNEYCLKYSDNDRTFTCYIPRQYIHTLVQNMVRTINMVEGEK